MKLSDVRGERTLDVIADLIGPVSRIAQDKEAAELFTRRTPPEGMEPGEFFAERVKKSVPKLLKSHKQDVIAVLATIEGTDPDEYSKSLNLAKVLRDVVELMTDEVFVGFLSSSETETGQAKPGDE